MSSVDAFSMRMLLVTTSRATELTVQATEPSTVRTPFFSTTSAATRSAVVEVVDDDVVEVLVVVFVVVEMHSLPTSTCFPPSPQSSHLP